MIKLLSYIRPSIIFVFCFAVACIGDPPWYVRNSTFGQPSAELVFEKSGLKVIKEKISCSDNQFYLSITGEGYLRNRVILRLKLFSPEGNELEIDPRSVKVYDELFGEIPLAYAPSKQSFKDSLQINLFFSSDSLAYLQAPTESIQSRHITISFQNFVSYGDVECPINDIRAEYRIM